MFGAWAQIRPDERRDTLLAFVSLFSFMCAHALLETARDALFLARISATQLPVVYLGVAAVALAIMAVQNRLSTTWGGRAVAAWLVFSALVTLGFWPLVDGAEVWSYALYVWSAVAVTIALTRFFILLGTRFSVTQAKRLYAFIGAGSVSGAIAGSATAGVLSTVVSARMLLLVAAGVLAVSAIGPLLLAGPGKAAPARRTPASAQMSTLGVLKNPYAMRVVVLVLVATMTLTFGDYVFKSLVAEQFAPDELSSFFARVYLALNILSLVAQVALVQPIVRRFGITGTLALLPALLLFGGAGILVGGGILAALALKGADGSLRYSLHRTAIELLYVPMGERLRAAAKTFTDIAGQRGGQALASVVILGAVALGVPLKYFGLAIALFALVWIGLAFGLRSHYLALFRSTLKEAAERTHWRFPDLDVSSLESLLAALNSANDNEVQAALQLMAEQGKTHIIPSLILYHPSPAVVAEALEIFSQSDRDDFLPITDRLLDHEYAAVRSAALRARISRNPDEELLRRKIEVSCPVVKATALVGLSGHGYAEPGEVDDYFDSIIENGSDIAKEALARAIEFRASPQFEEILIRLVAEPSTIVRTAAVRAMAAEPSGRYLCHLVDMLGERELRNTVRDTLVKMGDVAFSHLAKALSDPSLDEHTRRHLPRTITRFPPEKAAAVLVEHINDEDDGVVRYKMLRGLARMVINEPGLSFDRAPLRSLLDRMVARAYRMIDWRLSLIAGAVAEPVRKTNAHDLLVTLLAGKEANAIENIFKLLGLLYPMADITTIYRGTASERSDVRASSSELLEHYLQPPLRGAVLGLIDDAPDAVRLQSASGFHTPRALSYEALLLQLFETSGESLRSFAVYHVGELHLTDLRGRVESMEASGSGVLATMVRRTMELLAGSGLPEPAK